MSEDINARLSSIHLSSDALDDVASSNIPGGGGAVTELEQRRLIPLDLLQLYRPSTIATGQGRPAFGQPTPTGRTSHAHSFPTRAPTTASYDLWRRLGGAAAAAAAAPADTGDVDSAAHLPTFAFKTDNGVIVRRLLGRLDHYLSLSPVDSASYQTWKAHRHHCDLGNRNLQSRNEAAATAWTFASDMLAANLFIRQHTNFQVPTSSDPDDDEDGAVRDAETLFEQLDKVWFGYAPEAGTGTSDLAATSSGDMPDRGAEDRFGTRAGAEVTRVLALIEHKPKLGEEMQRDLSDRGAKIGRRGSTGFRLRLVGDSFELDKAWDKAGTIRSILVQSVDQMYANKCRWLILLGYRGITILHLERPMSIVMSNFIPFSEDPDYLNVLSTYIALVLPPVPGELDAATIQWADKLGWKSEVPRGKAHESSSDLEGAATSVPPPASQATSTSRHHAPSSSATRAISADSPKARASSNSVAGPASRARSDNLAPCAIQCDLTNLLESEGDLAQDGAVLKGRLCFQRLRFAPPRSHFRPRHDMSLTGGGARPDTPPPSSDEDGSPGRPRHLSHKSNAPPSIFDSGIPLPDSPVSLTSGHTTSPSTSPSQGIALDSPWPRPGAAFHPRTSTPDSTANATLTPIKVIPHGRTPTILGYCNGRQVVIKFAIHPERIDELINEGEIYGRLEQSQSHRVAKACGAGDLFAGFWGLYQIQTACASASATAPAPLPRADADPDRVLALVTEYAGEGMDGRYGSLSAMTALDKTDVLAAYTRLHALRITHNDLALRHCCVHPSGGRVRVIDFSHATLDATLQEMQEEMDQVVQELDLARDGF